MKSNSAHTRPRRLGLLLHSPVAMLLAPLAMLMALGCSKMDSASYPGEDYGYGEELPAAATVDVTGSTDYRAGGGGGEYDFSEDMADYDGAPQAERSVVASPGQPIANFETSSPPARDAKGKANKAAKDQKNAADKAGEEGTVDGQGEPAIAEGDDQQPDHGRQIVYVAGMHLSVYDLEAAMAAVEGIPDTYGGWIHMRNQQQVVLRLPAYQLKPVMAVIASLGVVEARTLQAQDVTAEYVDLESRITVLRETQTQLLGLLAQAKTVEEALHVRRALDEVTMELELALGRMRQLSDLIAFSTLTVTLVERGPQDNIPTSNDPFRWVDSLGVEATEWR